MSPVATALACSTGVLALAGRLVRVPAPVPFPPQPEDPRQFLDVRSAHVAVAQSYRADAEASRDKAKAEAKRLGGEAARLMSENATLTRKLKTAQARIVALEEMKLATAIEMVAAMGKADEQVAEGDEGEGEGSAAASVCKPRAPGGL